MRTWPVLLLSLLLGGCAGMKEEITTIRDPGQRAAAVDKEVVVIGLQTRTKQPQVNGVDVDGDYALSDKKVVARGVLRKLVDEQPATTEDGLHVASRGPGTYYQLVDPATGQLAKTKPAD